MAKKTLDTSKLPVWAQDKINELRYEVDKLERQLEIAQGASTGGETNVYIMEGVSDKIYLPEHTQVDFQLGDNYRTAVSVGIITDAAGRSHLRINGNSGISIIPRASNLIEIEIKE